MGIVLPKVFHLGADIDQEEQGKKRGKKKIHYSELALKEWETDCFCHYFEHLYFEKYKIPTSMGGIKGRSVMSRLIKLKGNEILKKHIENYMALDFFEVKSLNGFSANFVQGILDAYYSTGKLPVYESRKESKVEVDEEWAAGLEQIKGRW